MAEVKNTQVILKEYVSAVFPKESDMAVVSTTTKLKLPEGSTGVLVKNLYLDPFNPGQPISGFGVAKVLESGDAKFKQGELIWGMTGWEE